MVQTQPPPFDASASLRTAAVLAVAVIAVIRSSRKGRTALIILGWTLAGVATGVGLGFAFSSPEAAGTAAALLAQIMGIAAGIQQIWKSKQNPTNP